MLRTFDLKTRKTLTPATPDQVREALTYPNAWVPTVVAEEWVNEARRRNRMPTTSALAGRQFRADRELRARPKSRIVAPQPSPTRMQRITRRIMRLFRKGRS